VTALQSLWAALVEDVGALGGRVDRLGTDHYALWPPQGKRWAAWPEKEAAVFQLPVTRCYRRKRAVHRFRAGLARGVV
jgi:hypothetical protein